jgi:serine/threonine protein kinase/tetratricopeptide (TPR) repeat protein
LIGRTLGHYQITGLLGKGGMGEVYRARDTKLDRDVALKVLPAEVASDPARLERFQREAKTVAGLSHPHIVTLHSVEHDAGVHFLTMELIEGEGLDHALSPDGLPLSRVFDIGIAIADALAFAHEKGIIHRDLKPANVMISRDGHVKVLDFGLAKLSDRFASEMAATQVAPITSEGAVMGTVPYMSPEQLRGQAIDHRSDIFSLGVLLYEMATGRRPFGGATNTDVMTAILRDDPAPLTHIKPDLPDHMSRIVARCLEKEPAERYSSAKDLRNDLRELRKDVESGVNVASRAASARHSGASPSRKRWWIGVVTAAVAAAIAASMVVSRHDGASQNAAVTRSDKTIAVLPFVNMSAEPDQEYFSDGISEELLNLLSKVPDLRVAARTSSFSFKGENVEVPEIAKRLNVAYVLEGSVRKANDQVRITAQLIHAADGFHVWSETYDRKLDDIFAIQDEIAADVVKQLEIKLLGGSLTTRKTDPEAYALYLQSIQVGRQNTADAFEKSDALLDRALEIDSTYVPAWGGRAANFSNRALQGALPMQEGMAKSRAAGQHALAIDPQYAPAYAGLAIVAMYGDNDLAAAARYLERGSALDAANGRVLGNSATLLTLLGRKDEALALRKEIAARDPVNVNALFNLGSGQIYAGRFDDAIASYRTVLTLSPGNGVSHYQMGIAMLMNGDATGALAAFEAETVEVFRLIGLPMAYHALGRKAESDTALSGLIAKYEKDAAGNIAGVFAFRGERDRAFEWIEKELKNGGTFAEVLVDPTYINLYNDPRWLPFLRKVGKAPQQVDKVEFKVKLPG